MTQIVFIFCRYDLTWEQPKLIECKPGKTGTKAAAEREREGGGVLLDLLGVFKICEGLASVGVQCTYMGDGGPNSLNKLNCCKV